MSEEETVIKGSSHEEKQLLIDIAKFTLKMLRKDGCSRESLKRMIDTICNETPKGSS